MKQLKQLLPLLVFLLVIGGCMGTCWYHDYYRQCRQREARLAIRKQVEAFSAKYGFSWDEWRLMTRRELCLDGYKDRVIIASFFGRELDCQYSPQKDGASVLVFREPSYTLGFSGLAKIMSRQEDAAVLQREAERSRRNPGQLCLMAIRVDDIKSETMRTVVVEDDSRTSSFGTQHLLNGTLVELKVIDTREDGTWSNVSRLASQLDDDSQRTP